MDLNAAYERVKHLEALAYKRSPLMEKDGKLVLKMDRPIARAQLIEHCINMTPKATRDRLYKEGCKALAGSARKAG